VRGRGRVLLKLASIAYLTVWEPRSLWCRFIPSFAAVLVLAACAALATFIGTDDDIEYLEIKFARNTLRNYVRKKLWRERNSLIQYYRTNPSFF